ncbi:MAG: ATP-binding protein [Pelolinea sp.]|nr:ATP-binding protein [Pelolinea sp.]
MKELSLHILDIAENSVNAGATKIGISVVENLNKDELIINIKDNGKGMDPEKLKNIADPFITSRTTRKIGLGIPFLKAVAEACEGGLEIASERGFGTELQVRFKHSHIDRMPLGDLKSTWLNLLIGYPKVHWVLVYTINDKTYTLDDQPIKEVLNGIPLSDPQVIRYLKDEIANGFESVKINK